MMVAAEASNALIDLYGGDDEHCHRAVYDRLGVSFVPLPPAQRRRGDETFHIPYSSSAL
jgi:hypothetical protein